MSIIETDVVIIGGGPTGLFGVFQAGMLGMKVHLFDSLPELGGQCSALYPNKPIYDIPAHPSILAKDLIDNLLEQAKPFSPCYHLEDQVVSLTKHQDNFWNVRSQNGRNIIAKAVILACGNGAFGPNRPLIDDLDQFEATGSVVYHVDDPKSCAGKVVIIAGGGDSAADWTNFLGDKTEKTYLVHRREIFKCMPDSMAKIKELCDSGSVEILAPMQVLSLSGIEGFLESVKLKDASGNDVIIDAQKVIFCYGLKTYLGPIEQWNLDLDKGKVKVDSQTCETNLQGVYAVGDIASYSSKLKLILTGFSEVALAMHHAYRYVFPGKALRFQYSTDKGVSSVC